MSGKNRKPEPRKGKGPSRVKPGPKPSPRAGGRKLDPNPGRWWIDYALIDRGGEFAWPELSSLAGQELAVTLQRFAEEPLEEFLGRTRSNGSSANKPIEVAELCDDAQAKLETAYQKFAEIGEDVDVDLSIFALTYCYRVGEPRRIWAVYEPSQRRMYPMWWDPKHEVCGWDPKYAERAPGGHCTEDCPHPPDRDSY